ncbi:MFS transporter, partial [Mannheimia haemolytica]
AEYNNWDLIFYLGIVSQTIAIVILYFVTDFYKRNLIDETNKVSIFDILKNTPRNIYALIIPLAVFQGVFSSIVLYYQAVLKD